VRSRTESSSTGPQGRPLHPKGWTPNSAPPPSTTVRCPSFRMQRCGAAQNPAAQDRGASPCTLKGGHHTLAPKTRSPLSECRTLPARPAAFGSEWTILPVYLPVFFSETPAFAPEMASRTSEMPTCSEKSRFRWQGPPFRCVGALPSSVSWHFRSVNAR
jgi:hypothetical protein